MADLALEYGSEIGACDLVLKDGDLAWDASLTSLALASLLTDARASGAALPEGEADPRGWWGDALADGAWGGLLWTLARAKTTPETLRRFRDYAEGALAWMVEEGLARAIEVSAARIDGAGSGSTLALEITLHRPDGRRETLLYDRLWEALA